MKPKHKFGVSSKELGGKARRQRKGEISRRFWLWLVTIVLVIVLLASECIMLLPVE